MLEAKIRETKMDVMELMRLWKFCCLHRAYQADGGAGQFLYRQVGSPFFL